MSSIASALNGSAVIRSPVIWVIGATRSSKTPFARGLTSKPPAPMGMPVLSTGDYYRLNFGEEDTFSRDFVFRISAHSAKHIARNHECHIPTLRQFIDEANGPCIIEGERNPFVFANLYDPAKDIVCVLYNEKMDVYDTTIEGGVNIIEEQLRWAVKNGYAPQDRVTKYQFGNGDVNIAQFAVGYEGDNIMHQQQTVPRYEGDKYPFIDIMIRYAQADIQKQLLAIAQEQTQTEQCANDDNATSTQSKRGSTTQSLTP